MKVQKKIVRKVWNFLEINYVILIRMLVEILIIKVILMKTHIEMGNKVLESRRKEILAI
jgi:F0F1-type ATP synthase membrane subunit b/b'